MRFSISVGEVIKVCFAFLHRLVGLLRRRLRYRYHSISRSIGRSNGNQVDIATAVSKVSSSAADCMFATKEYLSSLIGRVANS